MNISFCFNSDQRFQSIRCLKNLIWLKKHPGGHFFDELCFRYFRSRSCSDHFYQIILNSTHMVALVMVSNHEILLS